MPSRSKDSPQSGRLFVSEEGEPVCFYLRPGPVKRMLLPLIKSGGGLLCNVQKPGTILLKDPEERASIPESTAHWYVSTKYIHDCIEKNVKLNIEEYRLHPESVSTKTNSKVRSPTLLEGRSAYTPEEDDAILSYVSKRESEIGGNRIWQEMAKQKVTSHSWQSMKYRYRVQLTHRLSEYMQADMEKENNTQNSNQAETEGENVKNASPQNVPDEAEDPENVSAETDLTQISQSSGSQEGQADVEQAKGIDTEECDSMETSKSEIDETPEQQQSDNTDIQKDASAITEKPAIDSNDKTPPNPITRPVTRQQFEAENAPYVKKLRSGASTGGLSKVRSGESPGSLNKFFNKFKPVSSLKRHQKEQQSPPKKVRRKTESNVAEQIHESENSQTELTQIDEGNCPAPPPAEKRKQGILEMATKEFEDDSESDSEFQTPGPSTSIKAVIDSSDCAEPSTSTSENQNKAPGTTQSEQNPQSTSTNTATATANIPAPTDVSTSDPVIPETSTRSNPPPPEQATSKAHLFIFENESQELEGESQSLVGSSSAAQTNEENNAPSLTQDLLNEDVQLLKEFMKHTNQDLSSVTKALLKASGDLFLAYNILQNPSSFSGPIWTRTDDESLCSTDQEVRQNLLSKYGEEGVAKRLMFLEMEG